MKTQLFHFDVTGSKVDQTYHWPKPTYDYMHAQARQVSRGLIPHSSGAPRHNGNPSILLCQSCAGGEEDYMSTLSKCSLSFFGIHIVIVVPLVCLINADVTPPPIPPFSLWNPINQKSWMLTVFQLQIFDTFRGPQGFKQNGTWEKLRGSTVQISGCQRHQWWRMVAHGKHESGKKMVHIETLLKLRITWIEAFCVQATRCNSSVHIKFFSSINQCQLSTR